MRALVLGLAATSWAFGCTLTVPDRLLGPAGGERDAGLPADSGVRVDVDAGQVVDPGVDAGEVVVGCPDRPICTTSDGLACDEECLSWGRCCRCLGGVGGVKDVEGTALDEGSCLATIMSGADIDVDPFCFNDLCKGVCSEVFGEVQGVDDRCVRFDECFGSTFIDSTDYPDDPACQPLEAETDAAVFCSDRVLIAHDAAPTCLAGSPYCEDLHVTFVGCIQGLAARFGAAGLGQSRAKEVAIEDAEDRYRLACGEP